MKYFKQGLEFNLLRGNVQAGRILAWCARFQRPERMERALLGTWGASPGDLHVQPCPPVF